MSCPDTPNPANLCTPFPVGSYGKICINTVEHPLQQGCGIGPYSTWALAAAGQVPNTAMNRVSDGLMYNMDSAQLNQGVPNTHQALIGSGDSLFFSIYTGAPKADFEAPPPGDTPNANPDGNAPLNQASLWQTPTDLPGPINVAQNANFLATKWWESYGNVGGAPTVPVQQSGSSEVHDTFIGCTTQGNNQCVGPTADAFKQLVYQQIYTDSGTYENNMNAFLKTIDQDPTKGPQKGFRGQDWTYMIHQGMTMDQGRGGDYMQIGQSLQDPNRKGGPFALMTVPYPAPANGIYDPSIVSKIDLVQACSQAPVTSLAPSYSFAGFCMEDLVFPDAWDPSKTQTLTCPTTPYKDSNGKPVKAPGIVCIQGNATDESNSTYTMDQSQNGLSKFANTADLAPPCIDIAINGNAPIAPNGNFISQDMGQGLVPWESNSATGMDKSFCIPQRAFPSDWPIKEPSDGKTNMYNSIPRCFSNSLPSNTTYGNMFFKNVCQAQLPMETWSHYASLNNNYPADNASGSLLPSNYTGAPTDILSRHWRSQPTYINNPGTPGMLGTHVDPSKVQPGTITSFYSYSPTMPFFAQKQSQFGGSNFFQQNDMSPFYSKYGLDTFFMNYGAVPGAAEQNPTLSSNPAYMQADFVWNKP